MRLSRGDRTELAPTITLAIVANLAFGAILDHSGLHGAVRRASELPRIEDAIGQVLSVATRALRVSSRA